VVCLFPRAGMTNYHRVGGLNNRNLFLTNMMAGSQRSKSLQDSVS
jgi:hypothetical protein